MTLKIGTSTIADVRRGASPVSKIYRGASAVWGHSVGSINLVAHAIGSGQNQADTSAIDTTGATLLVAAIAYYGTSGLPSFAGSKNNSWTALDAYFGGDGVLILYYCKNPVVGTNHSFSASATNMYGSLAVAAFSGTDTIANADGNNGAGASSTSSISSGSISPSDDGELIISACLRVGNSAAPSAAGFTLTDSNTSALNFCVGLGYKLQTTAAPVSATWQSNVAANRMAATIAAFKSV